MNKHEPHATFLDGRYRLDRLVVAHDDVIIWDATDLARGRSVQLSVFERGSAVLDQGTIAGGMFVALDTAPHSPLLQSAREDEFAREPTRRRRAWPWALAGLTCALVAFAGWHAATSRAHPVSEATITGASMPAPEVGPPPPVVVVQPPDPPHVVEPPPTAHPPHHVKPSPFPALQRPKQARPHPPPPTNFDPLTI